jgi:3-hydroxybutyryl-CoA dehydrogenase
MNVDVKPSASNISLIEPMEIASVGVIGGGQMGNGIAHVCALAGLPVVLLDVKAEALTKAMATMARNMDRQVNRSIISSDDRDGALARITTSTDYAAFGDSDLVIEAATEKEDVKRLIFDKLTPKLKPSCLIASNTSSISITRLGAATDRPEKFIGMHFMNPVPVMKLVEIIRGIATDEPTFLAVQALARKLGKIAAVAEDFPAFIVNRILVPMINEAVYALYEGVGSVSGIDTSMRLGANHPHGPAGTGRLHRSRYLPVDHAGAVRRSVRQQVPPLPAAGEICRGRVVGPQNRPRFLRLFADPTAPHALISQGSAKSVVANYFVP